MLGSQGEWHPWLLAEGEVELDSLVNPTLPQRNYAFGVKCEAKFMNHMQDSRFFYTVIRF